MLQAVREILPARPRAAEIGSWRGEFAGQIHHELRPKTLHILDLWENSDSTRYVRQNEQIVRAKFAAEIAAGRVFTIKGKSTDTIPLLPPALEFAYLDTVHDYTLTATELKLLEPHIDEGGFLCGHDYTHARGSASRYPYRSKSNITYGVIEAVNEFLLYNPQFVLAFVTDDWIAGAHASFCMMRKRGAAAA